MYTKNILLSLLLASLLAPGALAQQLGTGSGGALVQDPESELVLAYAAVGPRIRLEDHHETVLAMSKSDRREYAVDLLKQTAEWSQAPLLAYLQEQEALGKAHIRRRIWLNNVVSFEATPDVVDAAASVENVLYVRLDRIPLVEDIVDGHGVEMDAMPAPPGEGAAALQTSSVPTNISRVNADDVWALGYDGEGILVAVIDTRFNYNHPDLAGHQWSNPGETINGSDDDGNGYVDDFIGWDFGSDDNKPYTTSNNTLGDGHGTRVAGTVLGDGSSGQCTGVAPGATGMYCSLTGAPESDWWAAYQYAVDEGADVIDSSNSLKWPGQPDYAGFRQATDMELLAGVIHANSIGNQGLLNGSSHPTPFNCSVPGNCPAPWTGPDQTQTGGVSAVMGCGALASATSNSISSTSGRGPSAWTMTDANNALGATYPNSFSPYSDYFWNNGANLGLLKPDVCAPSNNGMLTTSNDYLNGSPGVFYNGFGGTSGATPHLGGMMALLLSIDPYLKPEELARIIQQSAVGLGTAGKDNTFGSGRIDCLAAAMQIFSERGGLRADDYVLMSAGGTGTSSLTHIRSGGAPLNVFPQIAAGTLPSNWGNGSIEHIDNTSHMLIGEGTNGGSAPYSVYLLDFSASCVYPTAFHLGDVPAGVLDIEYDRFSGNAYLALSNGEIRAINGPVDATAQISIGNFASGTAMTGGIAVTATGTELIGASASAVYRICPYGSPQMLFSLGVPGCNGIDVDHITGDIYVDSFSGDLVSRYDRFGNFIEDVIAAPFIDGADDVEFHQRLKRAFSVGRNGGAASLCLFGGCIVYPFGDQPGNDNVVVGGVRDNGGSPLVAAPTVVPHGNDGTTANLAVAAAVLSDTSFFRQTAGTPPRGNWDHNNGGSIIQPSSCGSSDAGFPTQGARWLEISADDSDDATPPMGGNPPVGVKYVRTYFAFDRQNPLLHFDLAFVDAEGVGSSYVDFGGAYATLNGQTEVLVHFDTNSTHNVTSSCYNDPVAKTSFQANLRTIFPTIRVGEVVDLVFYVGNDQDDSVDSHLYVDDVRLTRSGLRLDVTTPNANTFDVQVTGAAPNANLLTLLTLTPNCPRGAGPAAGLHGSAFEVISFFAPPIWAVADGTGQYAWSIPGLPPGLIFEFVTIEFLGSFQGVSNIGGPIVF